MPWKEKTKSMPKSECEAWKAKVDLSPTQRHPECKDDPARPGWSVCTYEEYRP